MDEYGVTYGIQYVEPQKPTLFDGHYLRSRSTLDIGVLGYIGIVQHKEHSSEVSHISPGTTCIYIYNKTSIKGNILTINKINREVGRAKDLSAPLLV